MDSCDVLIVGGGPGGSSCARALLGTGLDVVIMDRKRFPRDKVCAGWITPHVIKSLEIDTHDYAQGRVFQEIYGFNVRVLGRKSVRGEFKKPISYGILRVEFDDYLLRRSGARLRLGESVQQLERVGDRWRVNGSIEAKVVVGAGGHFCPIARHLGIGDEEVVLAQEIEFKLSEEQRLSCPVDGTIPELFAYPDLNGYAWIFRKGDHLNLGLGRESVANLGELPAELLTYLVKEGLVPADAPRKFKGHAYVGYCHARRKVVSDGILLIGDAAALCYDSGEGIRSAVESGILAAETIRDAAGDYSTAGLASYQQRLRRHFGRPIVPPKFKGRTLAMIHRLVEFKFVIKQVVLPIFLRPRDKTVCLPQASARSMSRALAESS